MSANPGFFQLKELAEHFGVTLGSLYELRKRTYFPPASLKFGKAEVWLHSQLEVIERVLTAHSKTYQERLKTKANAIG